MAISRLYTFSPNTTILSAEANAELNQLIAEVNLMFKKDGSDAITNDLTVNGNATLGDSVTDVTTVTGELRGSRQTLCFYDSALTNADKYIGAGNTTGVLGYKMHRAGSVVGVSFGGTSYSYTSNMGGTFSARLNGADITALTATTWTANNQAQGVTATYSRNTAGMTFVAGDYLQGYWNWFVNVASVAAFCMIEVQYNT